MNMVWAKYSSFKCLDPLGFPRSGDAFSNYKQTQSTTRLKSLLTNKNDGISQIDGFPHRGIWQFKPHTVLHVSLKALTWKAILESTQRSAHVQVKVGSRTETTAVVDDCLDARLASSLLAEGSRQESSTTTVTDRFRSQVVTR